MNAHTWRHAVLATILGGSMALAGCGDDDGEETATDFCTAVADFESPSAVNPATASADQLEAQFTQLRSVLDDLSASAPAELQTDVETVTSTFEAYIDAFEAQGYDYAAFTADAAGQDAMAALSSEEMGTATGNMLAYADEQCGG